MSEEARVRRGKCAVVLSACAAAALIVATVAAMRWRKDRDDRVGETEAILNSLAGEVRAFPEVVRDTNQRAAFFRGRWSDGLSPAVAIDDAPSDWSVVDCWGHFVEFRCPGPIHKSGWDIVSLGPNGVYENGEGDDIVVGFGSIQIGASGAPVSSR